LLLLGLSLGSVLVQESEESLGWRRLAREAATRYRRSC
jgi:hypothetical protein